MHRRLFPAAAALLLVILLLFFGASELREPLTSDGDAPSASATLADDPELATPVAPNGRRAMPATGESVVAVLQAEQRVRDLEATVALAQQRLVKAEEGLAASEAEVEELEQMIADIKARGEDPADYGDLAMERFQPAFFRFQDAQAAYDNAERLRAEAESALVAARADLARRRAANRGE